MPEITTGYGEQRPTKKPKKKANPPAERPRQQNSTTAAQDERVLATPGPTQHVEPRKPPVPILQNYGFHGSMDDGEPESGAPDFSTHERLEQTILELFGNTRSIASS